MKKILTTPKKCEFCGIEFNKKPTENHPDWNKRRFCCHQCFSEYNKGPNNYHWKGGIRKRSDGYLRYSDDTYVHRKVMEDHLGRKLTYDENIHHINGDPTDNRIENLVILSNSEHRKIETLKAKRDKYGRFARK